MKLKKGMILAAGYGKRMMSMTKNIPKPLIKIGKLTLLENCILKLKKFGIEEIVINTHYLSHKIDNFIKSKNFDVKIILVKEKKILDTGGGILNATKIFSSNPFIVLNPDTIWREEHINEFEILQKTYFDKNLIPILLVNKNKSFDKSFIGDFNLNQKGLVTRDRSNQMIYTGAQIINRKIFKSFNVKHFSINRIWDQLISKKLLSGIESQQKFFHINTKKTYEKLILEKIIH